MEQWEDQKLMPYQSGRDGTDLERGPIRGPGCCQSSSVLQRCSPWGRRNPAAMLTLGKQDPVVMLTLGKQGFCGDAHLGSTCGDAHLGSRDKHQEDFGKCLQ